VREDGGPVGVVLTVAAIAVSAAGGVGAELRWPDRAGAWARRALVVSLYTLIPFVVFFNLVRVELDADLGGGLILGWIAILLAGGAAWLVGQRLLGLSRAATGALICCTLVPNSGYLGYPLTGALLGFDALGEAVVYDIVVAAPALLLLAFATGAAFGEKVGERPRDRVAAFFTRNPPLYAAIAAAIAPTSLAPDLLVDISRGVVIALLPIGFFAVGAVLAEEATEERVRLGSPLRPPVASAILLRLALAPGLLYLLALPLIDLPGPYLLLAAMPCGINTLIVAHVYGLDVRLTAQAIAWSTVIALAGVGVAELT
jgi:malate permease and related proteins